MDSKVETLKHNFELTANGYVNVLCKRWEVDKDYTYWIGEDVGGLFDINDGFLTIDYDDLRYCVENDIKMSEYVEWYDYCLFCDEYHLTSPNFRSWHKGCPRLDEDAQKHLISLKADFEKACKEAEENLF